MQKLNEFFYLNFGTAFASTMVWIFAAVILTVFGIPSIGKIDFYFEWSAFVLINIVFLIGFFVTLKGLIPYFKDLKNVKNMKYEEAEGIVIGFAASRDVESGVQINDRPRIKLINSETILTLHVSKFVERGEKYLFKYLENTKVAIAIPRKNGS